MSTSNQETKYLNSLGDVYIEAANKKGETGNVWVVPDPLNNFQNKYLVTQKGNISEWINNHWIEILLAIGLFIFLYKKG